MKNNVFFIILIVLLLIVGYQAYRLDRLHKEYAQEQLNTAIQSYFDKQAKRDSFIVRKLQELKNADFKIKEKYYYTKQIVKADAETLKTKSDSDLTHDLEFWIDKRTRASELNEKASNR